MRINLIIAYALLIVNVSSGTSVAYYTVEETFHQSMKNNRNDGGKEKEVTKDYYLYSNLDVFSGKSHNLTIFSTIRKAFVPVDKICIYSNFHLNNIMKDSAVNDVDSMINANIALKNNYDEYRRLQHRPRELLKGLAVPSLSDNMQMQQFEKGNFIGNSRTLHLKSNKGLSEQLQKKTSPSVNPKISGMDENGHVVLLNSSYKEKEIHPQDAGGLDFEGEVPTVKDNSQTPLQKNEGGTRIVKTGINIDRKESNEPNFLNGIIWGIAVAQEFIFDNPQIIFIGLLIITMVLSIMRSNTHRR